MIRSEKIVISLLLLFFAASLYIIFAPNLPAHTHPGKVFGAISELRIISNALDLFLADNARYPTTTEGLNALLTNPNLPTWHGPYLTRLRTDPWSNPYRYTSPPPMENPTNSPPTATTPSPTPPTTSRRILSNAADSPSPAKVNPAGGPRPLDHGSGKTARP